MRVWNMDKVGQCRLNPAEARVERDWFQLLRLKCDESLSRFGYNFNLRRYNKAVPGGTDKYETDPDSRKRAAAAEAGLDIDGGGAAAAAAAAVTAAAVSAAEAAEAGIYTRPRFSST